MDSIDIGADNGLIGKYQIVRKLGDGASSEVFLCRDDFHNRDVAVKRVRSNVLGRRRGRPGIRTLFCRRGRPGGAPCSTRTWCRSTTRWPDPVSPYVVMEYVPGTTLRSFCRPDQLLPLELIVEVGFKCAMALGYVYRQGLIHRDVKPANIMAITNSAGVVTDVKITDFGSVLNLSADSTQIIRWARWLTWRPSSSTARCPIAAPTFMAWAPCFTTSLLAGRLSTRPRRPP